MDYPIRYFIRPTIEFFFFILLVYQDWAITITAISDGQFIDTRALDGMDLGPDLLTYNE